MGQWLVQATTSTIIAINIDSNTETESNFTLRPASSTSKEAWATFMTHAAAASRARALSGSMVAVSFLL